MISLDVKVSSNTFTPRSRRARIALTSLPQRAFKEFVANTPIRTGNARRNTRLTAGSVIEARYAYAQRLDQGYSRQSPQGMIKPTEKFIRKELARIARL